MKHMPLLLAAFLGASSALAAEPRVVPGPFPTNGDPRWGGGIYPSVSGPGVVIAGAAEVTGPATLDLRRHYAYEDIALNTIDTSLTIIYTIDGKPVSPRLKSPYTWTWDSATVPDGGHVVSEIIVDGTGDTTKYNPIATTIVVDNVPGPVLGPQLLPSLGGGTIRVMQRTAIPEWLPWDTGYVYPHPASTAPYVAPVSPPAHARGLPDGGFGQWFGSEPLTQANVGMETSALQIVRAKTGHIFVEITRPEVRANADDSLQGVLALPMMDGPRNDNGVSPYSTYIPNPVDRGYVGIDLGGRVFKINMDGSVVTIAGRQVKRDVVPYSAFDPRVTEADRRAWQINMIGDFHGVEFKQPNDLAFDPRSNGKRLLVADTENHRIARVDLSVSPPNITTCAGDPNNEGDADGPAQAARFIGPSSIVVADDGTAYVADYDTGAIRKIAPDCGPVSTIATGLGQPFAIRFNSRGNLIIDVLGTGALLHLDVATHTVTTILASSCGAEWTWIDVDRKGNIGPIDDILINCAVGENNNTLNRVSADGTRVTAERGGGHYPWALVIDDEEARFLTHGFGDSAPISFRLSAPGDVDWTAYGYIKDIMYQYDNIRFYLNWFDVWGSVPEFPVGARPAMTALRTNGYSTFPNVASYDDLASLTTARIKTFITGGLGGGTPRPEITGHDLDLAAARVQINSALFPNQLLPDIPPAVTDTAPPVISNVQATLIDGTTARVTWDTDEPTLGYVRFGSTVNYFRFSDIESSFSTSHAMTLSYLPENTTEHFAIVVEDQASNFTMTPDHTVAGGPPPQVPTAALTASSLSIVKGQSTTLSWTSANATGCTGTGFTAGSVSGSAVVAPLVTATYALVCAGPGGSSPVASVTVAVTVPPPPGLQIGANVKTTVPLDVYATPATSKKCTQKQGAFGTVVGGPTMAAGYTWWNIDYAIGCDGWSAYQALGIR